MALTDRTWFDDDRERWQQLCEANRRREDKKFYSVKNRARRIWRRWMKKARGIL